MTKLFTIFRRLIIIAVKFYGIFLLIWIGLQHFDKTRNILNQDIVVFLLIYIPTTMGFEQLISIIIGGFRKKKNGDPSGDADELPKQRKIVAVVSNSYFNFRRWGREHGVDYSSKDFRFCFVSSESDIVGIEFFSVVPVAPYDPVLLEMALARVK